MESASAVLDPVRDMAARHGLAGVALDDAIGRDALAEMMPLLRHGEARVRLVFGCPGQPREPERPWTPRLCAPDGDERDLAVSRALRALELASDLDATACFELGSIDPATTPERRLRWTPEEMRDLKRVMKSFRREPAFDAACFSIDALVERAVQLEAQVAIGSPPLPIDLPSPAELDSILATFLGAPLCYVHDVAAARLGKDLGGPPGRELLDAGRNALHGVVLADASEREIGIVPGEGSIDFAGLRRAVGGQAVGVVRPEPRWSEGALEDGIRCLKDAGW